MIKRKKQIKRIIKHFKFDEVRTAMLALDWRWYRENSYEVPTVCELKIEAVRLLEECEDQISCGGFRVRNVDGILTLVFEVDAWAGDNEVY